MTGDVDNMQPAGDWQRFSICHVAINPHRFHPLLRTPHEGVRGPRQQARGRIHGAEGATSFGERGVQRVHIGGRTGFPNDRRRAANVVRMAVRENRVPEIPRGTSLNRARPRGRARSRSLTVARRFLGDRSDVGPCSIVLVLVVVLVLDH